MKTEMPLLHLLRLMDSISDALLARKLRRPFNHNRSLKSAATKRGQAKARAIAMRQVMR